MSPAPGPTDTPGMYGLHPVGRQDKLTVISVGDTRASSPPSESQPKAVLRHDTDHANSPPHGHEEVANLPGVDISKTAAAGVSSARPKHNLDMFNYWDLGTWSRLNIRGSPTIREVFGLLGLDIPSKNTHTKGAILFEDPLLSSLNRDVYEISARLQKDDALPAKAADRESLKYEMDALMTRHGMKIWGRDQCRSLVFEDPQDRARIILHLHQWIFLKAFNSRRNGIDAAKRKKGDPLVATGTKRAVQASSSATKPKKMKTLDVPRVGAGGSKALSPSLRKEPRSPFTDESDQERLFELAAHIVKYLHGKPDTITDKEFLTLLEGHWMDSVAQYEEVFGSLYPAASYVLTSWISERRSIIALGEDIKPEEQFLTANDIRIMRLKWTHTSVQHHGEMMDSTDILCYTFAKITDSTGKGTLTMFRDGLEKLHGELAYLQDGNVIIQLE